MKRYEMNEIFYSLQGEGVRAGMANVFVRFAGCNLRCAMEAGPRSPGGFDCDTEFETGRAMTAEEIHAAATEAMGSEPAPPDAWIIFTGGEPALQVDRALVDFLHGKGWRLAIETNGSVVLPDGFDWITVSPKVAEHAIRQRTAHEVKYVRGHGQEIPRSVVKAKHCLISPAFCGTQIDPRALEWCVQLVKDNPQWRLSVQQHKLWGVR